MPNKRKKGKRQISIWATEEEIQGIRDLVRAEGFKSLADFLRAKAEASKAQQAKRSAKGKKE
jgi:hypothetical protein